MTEDISVQEALTYEIANHWLTPYLSIGWMQDLMAKYMVKKAQRKIYKYIQFKSKLL